MRLRPALFALVVTVTLLGACSSASTSPEDPAGPRPRIDLDPEQYVRDYREETGADAGMSGAPNPSATMTEDGGAVAPTLPPRPPTPFEDNTFVDPGENPFVDARTQPKSTFGLDVDTGSFSVGRTFLTQGTLPPRAPVRTEEWVNALGSDQQPPADGDLGVEISGSAPPQGFFGDNLLRVGVAARDLTEEERPPANLTFVVDTSGSMDIRERMGLVKASLGLLLLNLRDDDSIAIVEYSDEAGVVLEPTKVADAQRIVDAIDELQPSNSTNLEAGLRKGYDQAQSAFAEGGINAVILASDGVANVGLTDPDGLPGIIQDRAGDGIHLVTVGYGMGNYNDDLMEQVADQGDGFYAYLDTYEQAENLFGDRLTSTLAVVAGDAKAQVTFDPDVVAGYRLIGYENRALDTEDFEDDQVDAGEIGAGHRVTALYEVQFVDDGAAVDPGTVVGNAAVRYRSVATGQVQTVGSPITYAAVSGSFDDAPASFRMQAATAAFAEWMGAPSPGQDTPLVAIRSVADGAAAELPTEGTAGSAVSPDDMIELMDLAVSASPVPAEGPVGE